MSGIGTWGTVAEPGATVGRAGLGSVATAGSLLCQLYCGEAKVIPVCVTLVFGLRAVLVIDSGHRTGR